MTTSTPTITNVEVIERPNYHCDLLPEGLPGMVVFNGTPYTVLPLGDDSRDGYRIENLNNGKVYDVDTSSGYPRCNCLDFTIRRGKIKNDYCKHCLALIKLRKDNIL